MGSNLGHYRILEKIGAGGMGVVYRAHDQRLDRNIAIKVLPAESFNDATARARLIREARAAASLNHPHICTIHEVGESDGQAYIAMELIEGEPLSARLGDGPLPSDQVVRYGLQLADALAHAHERGVIHRDLKSGNVLVTSDGRLKMLDFGLAKRNREVPADATTGVQSFLTVPGTVAGTLAYIAPEQLRGIPADARSDIWSLGVVLYEMAAGVRPFQGRTDFELTSAILNQPPLALPREVPPGLKAVIDRCLAKEPGVRYQSAREVRAALEAIQSGATGPRMARHFVTRRAVWLAATAILLLLALVAINQDGLRAPFSSGANAPRIESLAVLPLENLSGDPAQEYFADGMTDALTMDLARLGGIRRVIARGSVMRYKGSKKPLTEIAQELKVDALITGAVVRSGDRVRVTAELIKPATDEQLWAQGYERDLRDILSLQSELARAIANEIKVKLTPEDQVRLASARTVNPEAYDAFLKGRFHWFKMSPNPALQYFELALEKDPNYAPAYAGISMVWLGHAHMGRMSHREALPKAKAAALKALQLDDSSAEAHLALSYIQSLLEWDWSAAQRSLRRAMELNPNLPDGHIDYADLLLVMGRRDEALKEIERSLELDPLNSWSQIAVGGRLLRFGRYDDGIALLHKALKTEPNASLVHRYLWTAYHQKRMYEQALPEAKTFLALAGHREAAEAISQEYARAGYVSAMRVAAEKLEERSSRAYVQPSEIARLYLYGGDKDRAVEWLNRAYEMHDTWMVFLIDDPRFESLHTDPRFQDLLRKMKFPGMELEARG